MKANPTHEAFYQELTGLLRKYADQLSAVEILAICANMTGQVLALQNASAATPDQYLRVLTTNLELGNAQAITDAAMGKLR